MHRFTARITTACAAGLAALAFAGPAAAAPAIDTNWPAPTPNEQPDPFYTPPTTLPAAAPGDVLRARPAQAGPPTARRLANAWNIMYRSTDALGRANVVTGIVLVPKGKDPSTLPIVGFAPGTTGPAFRCTVSRFINDGRFYEQATVNGLLEAGYAVAITDYEGYKENPDTTYITGKAEGPAVLDAIRAAQRLPQTGLSSSAEIATVGYSQGGGASMWAGEFQPTYAPELNLVAVTGGGVPARLIDVALSLEGGEGFGFLLNSLIGLDNAYSELNLSQYLNANGVEAVNRMQADECTAELLLDYAGDQTNMYLTRSPFLQAGWIPRLEENTLGLTAIDAPVFQYHGTKDTIVDFSQAQALANRYCELGMDVTFQTFDTDHVAGVARGKSAVLSYLADRFAGVPASSNC